MSTLEPLRVSIASSLAERMRFASDPARMRTLLADCLPGSASEDDIHDVSVVYAAAVPDEALRVWYRMRSVHRDGSATVQHVAGLLEAAGAAEAGPDRSPHCRWLPQIGMQIWNLPADPELHGLARLLDPSERHRIAGPLALPQEGTWELVRYVPGKRAMLRFDAGESAEGRRSVFCKVYRTRKAAQRALDRHQLLWQASSADSRAMPTPRPLHLDAGTASLWLESLPGNGLGALATEEAMFRVGTGLAALHGSGLELGASWSPEAELEAVRQVAPHVAHVLPESAAALRSIRAGLEMNLRQIDFGASVPCHGSFRLNHILWDGHEARLLDLDSALMASPWFDIANLHSQLDYLECQGGLDRERAGLLLAAFRAGYEGQSACAWNAAALDWFRGSLLLRKQAYKCVKHLHTDAGEKIRSLLRMASARCDALHRLQ